MDKNLTYLLQLRMMYLDVGQNLTFSSFIGGYMSKRNYQKEELLPLIVITDPDKLPKEIDYDPNKEIILEIDF